jgi:DNA invertase Pin-like site-specific DNA recombinase
MSIKAVSYLRTSSQTNVGGDSDKRQRQAIQAYAVANDIEIEQEYWDQAVSGADPVETRPGFAAMLDKLESNGVRVVLVEDASRFARSVLAQELGVLVMMQRGVAVVTVNTGDDLTQSDDPTKVAMRQLAGVFAQFEKARLVQKLKSARDRKSQELGMRIEGPSYRRQRPEAFQALQELRAAHPDWSHPMLAEALEQQGIVTSNGKRLAPTQVSRLLQQIEAKA